MAKTVVSYVRVSTTGQGRSGLGLEAQREAIARFAKDQNYTIGAEYLEVESGKGADALERRPKLAEAIRHARKALGVAPGASCGFGGYARHSNRS